MLRADLAALLFALAAALAGFVWMLWGTRSHNAEPEPSSAVSEPAAATIPTDDRPEHASPRAASTITEHTPSPPVPASPGDIAPSMPTAPPQGNASVVSTGSSRGTIDEHPEIDTLLDQIEAPADAASTPAERLHRATSNYQVLRGRLRDMDTSLQEAERTGDVTAQQHIITRFRRLRTDMLSLQSEADELHEQGVVDPTVSDASASSHGD